MKHLYIHTSLLLLIILSSVAPCDALSVGEFAERLPRPESMEQQQGEVKVKANINDTGSKLVFFVPALFGGFIALIGIGMALWLLWKLYRGLASKGWPSAPGTITSSEIMHDGDGYYAKVTYDYMIQGGQFTGKRVSVGDRIKVNPNPNRSQQTINRYPVGKNIPVYYHPGDPTIAVLQRKAPWRTFLHGIILSIIILLFAAAFISAIFTFN